MTKHDTMEELNKIAQEVYDSITNPNISKEEKAIFLEMNCISMALTADKFDISVREVWNICKKFHDDPNIAMSEPPVLKTREEEIFWHSIEEYEGIRGSIQ